MRTFKAGTKAYFDTFAGLIPCKVIEVITPGNGKIVGSGKVAIQITKTHKAYRKGEILQASSTHVVPSPHIVRKQFTLAINTMYAWA